MLDLDALEALLAKATPGEWSLSQPSAGYCSINAERTPIIYTTSAGCQNAEANHIAIVAIHTAAPALIAELRELRADEKMHVDVIGDLMAETTTLKAEIEKSREANRWRPIADGLPDERLNVLIYDGETINKAFQRGGVWYCDVFHGPVTYFHFLPLHDLPEGA